MLRAAELPVEGPVMLIGNHPNDLPDILAGLEVSGRHVRYVATISATLLPLASATYRGMGVIPVMRVRDVRKMRAIGVDVGAVNAAAFDTVQQAFCNGDVVGVFPEGGVHDTSALGKPRAGVAKMALRYVNSDAQEPLLIAPFGVHYDAPRTFRSDLTIQVGSPLNVRAWHARLAEQAPQAAESALNERMYEMLLGVTRSSSSWDHADARDRLVAAVAAFGADGESSLAATAVACQHRCADLIESDSAPDWRALVAPIAESVARAGGIPTSARDTARVFDAAGAPTEQARWPSIMAVVAAAPVAVVGLLVHAPLWWVVRRAARQMMEVRTDYVAKAILPGLHLMLLGYLCIAATTALVFRAVGVSLWWVVPVVMALPRLGDLALWWRDAVRAIALRVRVRRWSAADRAAVRAARERFARLWLDLSSLHV